MTLNQLETLTEDELAILVYVVNVLFPVPMVPDISPRMIPAIKNEALLQKLKDAFPHLKIEAHPIYSSLLTKLGVEHKIEYETNKSHETPTSGSTEISGSQ